MPAKPAKLLAVFSTYPRALAALSTGLLAVFALQTEISSRLDGFILTEVEAADFAEQQRLTNYRQELRILELKLHHETDGEQRRALYDAISYYRDQIRTLECLSDPKMERELCLR
jgi:hypothetical protein|tara:strand:+ start:509 stop:853 length:345 start_codon:yes stop_codon:yes gene_type:complete